MRFVLKSARGPRIVSHGARMSELVQHVEILFLLFFMYVGLTVLIGVMCLLVWAAVDAWRHPIPRHEEQTSVTTTVWRVVSHPDGKHEVAVAGM